VISRLQQKQSKSEDLRAIQANAQICTVYVLSVALNQDKKSNV
jgi:hypothetical protein